MIAQTVLLAILSSLAAAQNSYDCADAKTFCQLSVAAGTDTSFCEPKFTKCQDCNAIEQSAIHTEKDAATQLNSTTAIQRCYIQAESVSLPAFGPYDCQDLYHTCVGFPLHDQPGCETQYRACRKCAEDELSCAYQPGANQADCSSKASGCLDNTITQYYSGSN